MKNVQEHYWTIYGRDATEEELAQEMNITTKEIHRLQHVPRYIQDHSSRDEQTTPMMDQIQAPISEVRGIDIEFFRTSRAKKIMHIIHEALDAKERTVLTLRFGLDGNNEKTLQEIGAILNMTREGIRLIEVGALRKLRKRYPEIRDFIEN
jgi:RNA polymerase primary sigma factor